MLSQSRRPPRELKKHCTSPGSMRGESPRDTMNTEPDEKDHSKREADWKNLGMLRLKTFYPWVAFCCQRVTPFFTKCFCAGTLRSIQCLRWALTVGHGCWERGESKIQHGIAGPLDVSPKRSHGTFNEKTSTLLVMVTSWTPMLSCLLIDNMQNILFFFCTSSTHEW